jgi:hypothetical protein
MHTIIQQRSDYTFKYNRKLGRHGWLRLTPAYSVKLVNELLEKSPQNAFIFDRWWCGQTLKLLAALRAALVEEFGSKHDNGSRSLASMPLSLSQACPDARRDQEGSSLKIRPAGRPIPRRSSPNSFQRGFGNPVGLSAIPVGIGLQTPSGTKIGDKSPTMNLRPPQKIGF